MTNKMSEPVIVVLQRFKDGLIQFLDELINWMPRDEELLATRILIANQLPIEEIMQKFIQHVKPFEKQIEGKDDAFFLNDPQVFGKVKNQGKVMSLKNLWINPEFTPDDKAKAWQWMNFFVRCINLYQQHTSVPVKK